jgi:hypothetical protein
MALKRFVFEFDDESAAASGVRTDGITFECSGDESLSVEVSEGATYLFANRAGMITLAKMLLKLGLSDYKSGFHFHLAKDFDASKEEILCIGVGEQN